MIGVVVLFGVLTTCSADSYLERELLHIRTTLQRQEMEIKELRNENKVLRNENKVLRADVDRLNVEVERLRNSLDNATGYYEETHENNNSEEGTELNVISGSDVNPVRHTRVSPEPVAFYAYMSTSEFNPSIHYTLIFDVAKTNLGGHYNKYFGAFTAPSAGVYVFAWTIYTANHGQTRFDIYVNHDIVDGTLGKTSDSSNDYDSDSGTMVVSLNAHDSVYIRSSMVCTTYVISGLSPRTSFAGWKIY
jgi:FtsZ-binding cell division protein ZapB